VAYTPEFKLKALRQVCSQEAVRQVGREIGVAEQSNRNWVKALAAARLGSTRKGRPTRPKQMDISRPHAEDARLKMEVGIVRQPPCTLRGSRREVDRGNVRFAVIEYQLGGSSKGRSGSDPVFEPLRKRRWPAKEMGNLCVPQNLWLIASSGHKCDLTRGNCGTKSDVRI
jgi:transposase